MHQLGQLGVLTVERDTLGHSHFCPHLVELQYEDLAQAVGVGDTLHHHGLRPEVRHPALLRSLRSVPGHQLDIAGLYLAADEVGGQALDGPVVPLRVEAELEEARDVAHTELGGRQLNELLQYSFQQNHGMNTTSNILCEPPPLGAN